MRIPAHLIEWATKVAPSGVVLCDRDGNAAIYVEDGRYYYGYGTGSDTRYIVDPYTRERRLDLKQEVANMSRPCDFLSHIDFVMCMGIASDVTDSISDLHHFEAMVSDTKKSIVLTCWNVNNLRAIVNMAEAMAGGKVAFRRIPFAVLYGAAHLSPDVCCGRD